MIKIINNSLWDLPSPATISYFWNFGSTLGLCLAVQIFTGLLLRFHYLSYREERFNSIVDIMREVWSGWAVRLVHINGASIFFFFIYLHLFRGMYFMRRTHKKVWIRGVTILIIIIAISFIGYVLPWGQISYWAVAVITNLFSVVPLVGDELVRWIWGGYSVGSPTLTRFYSLHFLTPFILRFAVILHLIFLHKEGSSNRLGVRRNLDKIQFHPYFSVKDLLFILAAVSIFLLISFFYPYILGDSVNNVPANPMQTPVHIQPEWYFLPFYAILRAFPRKTVGVMALALSVSIFYVIPIYNMKFSTKFNHYRLSLYFMLVMSLLILMKLGALPAEEPYVTTSHVFSFFYFTTILALNL